MLETLEMKEVPNYPLDLSRLSILPPSQWRVSLCENGVIIGAWVDESQRLHKRFFGLKDANVD